VAIIDAGRVVAQDDLSNLLTADRESYSVTFEPNGSLPEYLSAAEKQGTVMKGVIPKERLYDFMEFSRSHALGLHECSLKKTSLEEKFFSIVKGGRGPIAESAEQLK
jgi:ABC-type multidrug transport system ATPase subunit